MGLGFVSALTSSVGGGELIRQVHKGGGAQASKYKWYLGVCALTNSALGFPCRTGIPLVIQSKSTLMAGSHLLEE